MQSNPKEKLVLLLAGETKRLSITSGKDAPTDVNVDTVPREYSNLAPEGMKSDREINESTRRQMARIVERISKGP